MPESSSRPKEPMATSHESPGRKSKRSLVSTFEQRSQGQRESCFRADFSPQRGCIIMFDLDPKSILERVKASGQPPRVPTLGESVLRGTIGFTLVSLGGFAPWVFAGR